MDRQFDIDDTEALPAPLHATRAAVQRHGEEVRADVGLAHGFDIGSLIRANSGSVVRQGALETGDRALELFPDGRFQVYLSTLRTGLSNNMIAACELGHVVLHGPSFRETHPGKTMVVPKIAGEDDEDLRRCKWESVWFARGLLMPEREFMSVVDDRGLDQAARMFGVTGETATQRHEQIVAAGREAAPAPAGPD